MQIIDDGGGGSGICTISTSDLIGLQNNMLTRIAKLEEIVKLLTGMDVSANSLDEFSDSLGTVTNATLINAARGWITEGTFSGVAISTLGWTMADGSTYPIVVVDEDGVFQYGFSDTGTLGGAAGSVLAGTAIYYIVAPSSHQSGSNGVTLNSSSLSLSTKHWEFEIVTAGIYNIAASCIFECNVGGGDSGTAEGQINITINGYAATDGEEKIISSLGTSDAVNSASSLSTLHILSAGDEIQVDMTLTVSSGTLNNRAVDNARVGIVRMGGTA